MLAARKKSDCLTPSDVLPGEPLNPTCPSTSVAAPTRDSQLCPKPCSSATNAFWRAKLPLPFNLNVVTVKHLPRSRDSLREESGISRQRGEIMQPQGGFPSPSLANLMRPGLCPMRGPTVIALARRPPPKRISDFQDAAIAESLLSSTTCTGARRQSRRHRRRACPLPKLRCCSGQRKDEIPSLSHFGQQILLFPPNFSQKTLEVAHVSTSGDRN
jgi:hypothetical protein